METALKAIREEVFSEADTVATLVETALKAIREEVFLEADRD